MTSTATLSPAGSLIGREGPLGRFDVLLDAARAGRGGGVVLSGEAGVGKTMLLRGVTRRATGLTVLAATGLKSEATLSFATLGDLLRPLLRHLDDLPGPQATALRTAFALDDGARAGPLGRYAVCLGVLTLLSTAADRGPLLVVVDDAQWMDDESATALRFAARRLADDPVLVVLAVRDEPGRDADPAGLTEIRLGGLDRAASRALLASLCAEPVAPVVADELYEVTGGNPLALREIGGRLTAEQLAARRRIPDPLPIGGQIRRMFAARLEPLPAAGRLALLLLALSASPAVAGLRAPMRALGLDDSALDPARSAGLITSDGVRVWFAHPLIRSVLQNVATAEDRQTAYAALADAATGDEAVLYRAAGAAGPDDALAADLEAAARGMRDRLGFVAAARTLHRAATLTTGPAHRARRLLSAASLALVAGRADEATGWLESARELTADPALLAEVELARGRALTMRGTPAIAQQVLLGAADAVQRVDPRGAARLLCETALPTFTEGRIADGVALCLRAVRLAGDARARPEQAQGRLVLAQALAMAGRAHRARRLVTKLRPYAEGLDPVENGLVLGMTGAAHGWLERLADSRQTLDRVVHACRRAGALGPLAVALSHRCETNRRAGEWARARADGEEALCLAREIWQPMSIGFVLVLLAHLDAAQGRGDVARTRLEESRQMSGPLGCGGLVVWERGVRGLLHLAEGRPDEAIACLEPARDFAGRNGLDNPEVVFWEPDLVEAYWRAGRADRAAEQLEAFAARAAAARLPTPQAAVERCRGLLAGDAATAETHFRSAAAWHERCSRPFEQARTALCHGEAMRRHRRIAASRRPLEDALHTFRQLGAAPFAERAAAELAAGGGAPRPAGEATVAQRLSPQELQVALAVARGLSNPAIAGALFLSRKTVEAHLSRVYRKLGVCSRTQLVGYLAANGLTARDGGGPPAPDRGGHGRGPGSRTP